MPALGHCTAARCGNTAFPIASGRLTDNVRLQDVPKGELRHRAAFKEPGSSRLSGTAKHSEARNGFPHNICTVPTANGRCPFGSATRIWRVAVQYRVRRKEHAGRKPAAVNVEVVEVEHRDVPIYGEWIGTLDGLVNADVSDALIAYQKYYEVRKAQEETVQDLGDSVSTSLKCYRGGIATYLDVLDNQRSLFSAQLTLAQGRGNEFQSLVQLYKALGGG